MCVSYIDYLNAFHRWLENHYLPAASQLLYFRLLDVFNRCGWAEWVSVDNLRLMSMMGVGSKNALLRAREKLLEAGFLEYRRGKKGVPGQYKLVVRDARALQTEPKTEPKQGRIKRAKTKDPLEKNPTDSQSGVFEDYAAENTALLLALRDFEAMRRTRGRPMTDRARAQLCQKLASLAPQPQSQIELLNEAILHGWLSVYVPDGWRGEKHGTGETAAGNPRTPAAAYRLQSALDDVGAGAGDGTAL